MSDRAALIGEFLSRRDEASTRIQLLAVAACPAAFVDAHLLRRLRVVALREFHIPVDAETDLWWSPLMRDVSVSGAALHEKALPELYDRFRAWAEGETIERVAWRRVADVITSHPSNPLRRAQERITLAALGSADPKDEIAETLLPIRDAIDSGRHGVARWAERAFPRLPSDAKRSPSVWQVSVAARQSVGTNIDLGAAAPDASTISELMDLPLVELPIRRRDGTLELGAISAERTSGILVPDTVPRVVEICRTPDGRGETLTLRSGDLHKRDVGGASIFLRTLAGTVYEIEGEVADVDVEGEAVIEAAPRPTPKFSSAERTDADLVIVIPGLYGSVLRRGAEDLWNLNARTMFRFLRSRSFGDRLRLDVTDDETVHDVDGVSAIDLVRDLTIIPGLWRSGGYGRLLSSLAHESRLTPDVNLISFPWDWRRDIRLAARQLEMMVGRRLDEYRNTVNPEAKLVLIGHNLGGLVATWFTDVLQGSDDTRMVITLGTPFRGSVSVLKQLSNGVRVGVGPVGVEFTEMFRSFTSMYQMLPTYGCVEQDGDLLRIADLEIPNLDPSRVRNAFAMHDELDRATEAVDNTDRRRLVPVAGTGQSTAQSARIENGRILTLDTISGQSQDGDGTVSILSAAPRHVDRSRITYVNSPHGQLPENEHVSTQIAGLLHSSGGSTAQIRGVRSASVLLNVGDSYLVGQPVEIEVSGDSYGRVELVLQDVDGETRWTAMVGPLTHDVVERVQASAQTPGAYRLKATDESGELLATDIIAIGFDDMPTTESPS